MTRFLIQGLDRRSGNTIHVLVDASSAALALRYARERGLSSPIIRAQAEKSNAPLPLALRQGKPRTVNLSSLDPPHLPSELETIDWDAWDFETES